MASQFRIPPSNISVSHGIVGVGGTIFGDGFVYRLNSTRDESLPLSATTPDGGEISCKGDIVIYTHKKYAPAAGKQITYNGPTSTIKYTSQNGKLITTTYS